MWEPDEDRRQKPVEEKGNQQTHSPTSPTASKNSGWAMIEGITIPASPTQFRASTFTLTLTVLSGTSDPR